jgi:hypothetical protein
VSRRIGAGIVCALLAAVLGIFAADVSAWRSAFTRDDIRFRALPRHHDLWRPATVFPGDPAAALLGTQRNVRWREALQAFAATQTATGTQSATQGPALRATAQQRLLAQLDAAPTTPQRSEAANLLGVLVVTTPAGSDQRVLARLVKRGESYFKQAIALDPANAAAKENLELVLRIKKPDKGKLSRTVRSGYGFSSNRGTGLEGNGY